MVEMRRAGKTVASAWKEAGAFQIATQLAKPDQFRLFQEICARADGAIATVPDHVPLFTAAGVRHTEFIPTPYPIDDPRRGFSVPLEDRRSLFVGTREFAPPPERNHLAALFAVRQLAESMDELVTVFNDDGCRGRRMLAHLGYDERLPRVIEGRLPYPRYLRGQLESFFQRIAR